MDDYEHWKIYNEKKYENKILFMYMYLNQIYFLPERVKTGGLKKGYLKWN